MTNPEILLMVMAWLKDAGKHWLWGFLAGVLAYFLTLIIWYALRYITHRFSQRYMPTGVVFGIACILALLFIAFVLLSHLFVDRLLLLYTTPLGPPLPNFQDGEIQSFISYILW